jgi:hypothetical protein
MDQSPRVIVTKAPFGEAERIITLDRPMTVAEVIETQKLSFRLPTVAAIRVGDDFDLEPIMRSAWQERSVGEGQTLAFISMPGRGNNNSGKQIIGLVASIALSLAAPFVGGAVAGALGLGAAGRSLASLAFIAGGTPLLDATIPLQKGLS